MVVSFFFVTFERDVFMECRLTQKLKKKLFPVLSGLLLTSAFTLSPAALPAAEAFD